MLIFADIYNSNARVVFSLPSRGSTVDAIYHYVKVKIIVPLSSFDYLVLEGLVYCELYTRQQTSNFQKPTSKLAIV